MSISDHSAESIRTSSACTTSASGRRVAVYAAEEERLIGSAVELLGALLRQRGTLTDRAPLLRIYLRLTMHGLPRQRIDALRFDRWGALIDHQVLFNGTVGHCPCYPREVARLANVQRVCGVLLAQRSASAGTRSDGSSRCAAACRSALEAIGRRYYGYFLVGDDVVTQLDAQAAVDDTSLPGLSGRERDIVTEALHIVARHEHPAGPVLNSAELVCRHIDSASDSDEPTVKVLWLDPCLRLLGEGSIGATALDRTASVRRDLVVETLRQRAASIILVEHKSHEASVAETPFLQFARSCETALQLVDVQVTDAIVQNEAAYQSTRHAWSIARTHRRDAGESARDADTDGSD